MILEFYVESACVSKMEAPRCARYGALFLLVSSVLLANFWPHPLSYQLSSMNKPPLQDSTEHVQSGGVLVSAVFFIMGERRERGGGVDRRETVEGWIGERLMDGVA